MFKINQKDSIVDWGLLVENNDSVPVTYHDFSSFNKESDSEETSFRERVVKIWADNIRKALLECDHAVYAYSVMFNFFDIAASGWTTSKIDYDSIFFPIFEKHCLEHGLTDEEANALLN